LGLGGGINRPLKSSPWNLTQWELGNVNDFLDESFVHIMLTGAIDITDPEGGLQTDYLAVHITKPSGSGGGSDFDITKIKTRIKGLRTYVKVSNAPDTSIGE